MIGWNVYPQATMKFMLGRHLREIIGRNAFPQVMMKFYARMPKRNCRCEHLPPGYDEIFIPGPDPTEIIGGNIYPQVMKKFSACPTPYRRE